MLEKLSSFVDMAKSKIRRRLAVAAACDKPVLEAVKSAMDDGIISPILVGDKTKIEIICKEINLDCSNIEIIDIPDPIEASIKAVSLIRNREAEILMKGFVNTGALLKAVLDKDNGLKKDGTLSHVAFFESPYYHKLLCVTDAAMNIEPELEDKVHILNNAVDAFHKLGIAEPKVAVVGAVETVNAKMTPSVHGEMLKTMNKEGQIKGCIVEGPMALDNAISKESAEHKGIKSDVSGEVDIILTPDIYSGNIFYKSLTYLGGSSCASVIMGATVPIVLTSRSDTKESKMLSIALAAAM